MSIRENRQVTLLPSAARTATVNADGVSNDDFRGGHFVVDVTVRGGASSIIVKVQGFDETSQKWYDLLTSAAIAAVGTTVLKVYPGVTVAANVAVSDILPTRFRVRVEHANADSITYSVGASLVK